MSTEERPLTPSRTEWKQQILELQTMLSEIRPRLVAAEQRLSEQLADISSFEFLIRSRLEPLSRRLENLEDEIRDLKNTLRRMRDDYYFAESAVAGDLYEVWRSTEAAGSAAAGGFRYHKVPTEPPRQALTSEQNEDLKNLYRNLARRFHPDFALDQNDREYRTGIMMAINAAYTAGDYGRLQELAQRPDSRRPDYSDQELAEALLRELHHCQRRIGEIEKELAGLHRHPSYLLKKRVDEAALMGRDLLDVLASELREKISERMVQRDVLEAEIDGFEDGNPELADDAFADAVFNLGLEQVLTDDSDDGLSEWRDKYHGRFDLDEADDEAAWEALRRARKNR